METPDILKMSEVRTSEGRYPSQIVLHRIQSGTFATHLKVLPRDADPYLILGRYFFRLEDAEADFLQRKKELESL